MLNIFMEMKLQFLFDYRLAYVNTLLSLVCITIVYKE